MANGYLRMTVDGERVLHHRWVMEQEIGRPLRDDEHVHHINHDRQDNRPENLAIVDPAEHTRMHQQEKRPKQE